jgi:hypothetical protein
VADGGPGTGDDLGRSGEPEEEPDALDAELGQLRRWAAEARVARSVDERRRSAWLARQPDGRTDLAALLVAVAERTRPVVVEMLDGRRHRGSPAAVGRDVVELRTDQGTIVLVSLAAIASIRVAGPDLGDVAPTPSPTTPLAAELARLAEDRPRVRAVVLGAAAPITGTLVAAGPHVVTVRLDGGDVAYVPLAALAEVSVPESG